jgi:hypothetical protein
MSHLSVPRTEGRPTDTRKIASLVRKIERLRTETGTSGQCRNKRSKTDEGIKKEDEDKGRGGARRSAHSQ